MPLLLSFPDNVSVSLPIIYWSSLSTNHKFFIRIPFFQTAGLLSMVEAMSASCSDPGGAAPRGEDPKSRQPLDNCQQKLNNDANEVVENLATVSLTPITYLCYSNETQMPLIMRLIQKDLSEPYSIYTYRYFIHNWPNLCFLAMAGEQCVGAIVCKLDLHKKVTRRGYIAMLAVDQSFRKRKIGSTLVQKAIEAMVEEEAEEVVLETEITNKPALRLYEALGFVRDKRLFRYYLNGVDASRLKLWLR